jgi:hypothetical protein
MARPQKEGLDYFPHDTDASTDEKIEALRSLYGNNGYAFYFILLERIYRTPDFEIDISDAETIQILAKKCGINVEEFNQILSTALKRGCFDKEAYAERGVLTSNGVKKRAMVVVKKREEMRERYQKTKEISDAETRQEMNQETQPETPQSKVKERKEKERKVEDRKEEDRGVGEGEGNQLSRLSDEHLRGLVETMYADKLRYMSEQDREILINAQVTVMKKQQYVQ